MDSKADDKLDQQDCGSMGLMIRARLHARLHAIGRLSLQVCYWWIRDMRVGDSGDETISESHKFMDLTPVDGSSVNSFSSEP